MTERYTLTEIRELTLLARPMLRGQAMAYGRDVKIYLHWTAGHYGQHFKDYHIGIDDKGRYSLATEDFSDTLSHTWKRNTGAIGIALECAYGAGSQSLGDEPPTKAQIEAVARLVAVMTEVLNIPIDKAHVLTHGEAANNEDDDYSCHLPYAWWNDGYGDGDTRGDLEYLETDESPSYNPYATDGSRGGDGLRGKANWYRNTSPDGVYRKFD